MNRRYILPLFVTALLGFAGSSIPCSAQTTPAETRHAWYRKHVGMKQDSPFAGLRWQFLGPRNISGRVTDVAVETPRGRTYSIYAATASGGVWKTENEGTSWEPVFEHATSTSIGDVTLAPSNPDIVWIGTGEANIFRSSMAGAGVYKSEDGGKNWKYMGLGNTHTIPRIVIHPTDPDIVYVAASGHEWTDNAERGLYKTVDGGKSWTKVLYVDEKTGVIDLVMDPRDSNVLYAATWQRKRLPWNDPRNGPESKGSGIFKTTDGGRTWNPINDGLPDARFRGRIGIDLCLKNPDVIYAFIDNYDLSENQPKEGEKDSYGRPKQKNIKGAEVYRSGDGGLHWTRTSQSDEYMTRLSSTYGWVFGQIRVDPNDADTIYVMGISLNVSHDRGRTFKPLRGMHGDHHALWIDPDNSNYLVNGNDGGVVISYDGGKKWRQFLKEIPAVQFFNVGYDMAKPFRVYGSIQDHGSRRAVVDLRRGRNRIPAQEWEFAPGGEGSSHAIDPTDPNVVYSAGFYGRITRTNLATRKRYSLVPVPPKGEPPYRGQWLAPFIISPHNPRVIYHGMNYLFRSLDRGDHFMRISPDLTYNDPAKIGDISYQTLFTISESPQRAGLIYCGTDDGRAHMTPDGGKNWIEITGGLAKNRWISRVVASAYDVNTVYLAQNGKRNDDFAPYLWKSTDLGKTWSSIVANIPSGPINVIREDPLVPGVLYVGTDLGVYVSLDDGKSWNTIGQNLPTTFVHDLIIHPRDLILVIATHGRGMYAMDVKPIHAAARANRK